MAKKEELDKLMNCKCLQRVIEDDLKRFSTAFERVGQITVNEGLPHKSEIVFESYTAYRNQVASKSGLEKDRIAENFSSLPFFFCPICGTKTNTKLLEENSFYNNLQKRTP